MDDFNALKDDTPFEWGHLKLMLKGCAALVFVLTGISLTSTPRFETIFNASKLIYSHDGPECFANYSVQLGNTGSTDQPYIDVSFRSEDVDDSILPLKVYRTGVISNDAQVRKVEDKTIYRISELKKGRWITFQFNFRKNCYDLPDPEELVLKVEPSQGPVREGDPNLSRLARLLFLFI